MHSVRISLHTRSCAGGSRPPDQSLALVHEGDQLVLQVIVQRQQHLQFLVDALQRALFRYRFWLRRHTVDGHGPFGPTFLPGFLAPCFRIPLRMRSAIKLLSSSATAVSMVKTSLP
jgi:hypothetical protein